MSDIDQQPNPTENDSTANDPQLAEVEGLKIKAEEYLNGWKRAKADYLNYKKDVEKSQQESIQFANAMLLAELLPVVDHYKMAWSHLPAEVAKENWAQGFAHVKKELEDFLKNLGIEEIKTVGEKFNPEFHEAIDWQEKDGFAADMIFEQAQPGYTLHGKLLRPAKVKVAK